MGVAVRRGAGLDGVRAATIAVPALIPVLGRTVPRSPWVMLRSYLGVPVCGLNKPRGSRSSNASIRRTVVTSPGDAPISDETAAVSRFGLDWLSGRGPVAEPQCALDKIGHVGGGMRRQRVVRGTRPWRDVAGHLTGLFDLPVRRGGQQ